VRCGAKPASRTTDVGLFRTSARRLVASSAFLIVDVKLVEIDGLSDEIVCPELERGFDIVKVWIGGNHDDGAVASLSSAVG
jgi:hypothetical protein